MRGKTLRTFISFVILCIVTTIIPTSWGESYRSLPLKHDRIHDPSGAAINVLQDPSEAMAKFPMDRRGQINWVQTINEGLIEPRKSIDGDEFGGEMILEMDMDIIMTSTAEMPHVRFPHLAHTQWLACANCHPKIFKPQKDSNPINMSEVLGGNFCGRCHGKVAFPLWTCERCHSVPHEGSPAAWWGKK